GIDGVSHREQLLGDGLERAGLRREGGLGLPEHLGEGGGGSSSHHGSLSGGGRDDSRSSRKRSITRRERSSSLSDSPTIFEARSLARSPTSPRSWVEAASRSASSCCRPEASTRSDSAS